MKSLNISPEVLAVLKACEVTESMLVLPKGERLQPPLYKAVNKVIEAAGGQWSRSEQAHLFTSDPRERLGLAITTGVSKIDAAVAAPKLKAKLKKWERQAFYTPAALAARVVELADVSGKTVLEPSAGAGALVKECFARGAEQVVAVELDTETYLNLGIIEVPTMNKAGVKFAAYEADFLKLVPGRDLPAPDRVVMNPPFTKGLDIKHVHHAFKFLRPGGRLVAIMSPATLTKPAFAKGFPAGLGPTKVEPIPAGTFDESGTSIATIIVVIDKPSAHV